MNPHPENTAARRPTNDSASGPRSRPRCSDGARLREDPLIGTAPPAMRWLLIEQDGGWGREALTSLDAPVGVRSHIERALSESGARLQLIRRPGRRNERERSAPRQWFVIDIGTPGSVAHGSVDDGWVDVVSALHTPRTGAETTPLAHAPTPPRMSRLSPAAAPHGNRVDIGSARPDEGPPRFILVCTNGRHDVCCAVRGRPVAAALAGMWPGDVWECTHTGGDRFAGNVVVLPEGVVYGALDAGSAVAALDAHIEGRYACRALGEHLRGFVGFRPAEQAARAALAPLLGEAGLPPWERGRLTAENSRHGADWACEVSLDGTPFATVSGHDEIRPARHLTCSATAVSRARVPVVDEVDRVAPS